MARPLASLNIHQLLGARAPLPPRGGLTVLAGGGVGEFKAAVPLVPISKESVDARAQRITGKEYQQVSAATMEMEDNMVPLSIHSTKIYAMSYEELKALSVCEC